MADALTQAVQYLSMLAHTLAAFSTAMMMPLAYATQLAMPYMAHATRLRVCFGQLTHPQPEAQPVPVNAVVAPQPVGVVVGALLLPVLPGIAAAAGGPPLSSPGCGQEAAGAQT